MDRSSAPSKLGIEIGCSFNCLGHVVELAATLGVQFLCPVKL